MKLHLLSVALICIIFSQPTRAQGKFFNLAHLETTSKVVVHNC
jgi:hypothetical protein